MKHVNKKQTFDFCFHHWTRKPYAAFNSLKKVFKTGVVAVCYTMVALATQDVFAQPDTLITTKTVILNEATVSSTRQQIYSEMARIVNIINKDEIKQMPVRTLEGLLENISSVDVRSRGAEGVQADVSIRGGTFDQVLILLNGINITDPQTGHHNLNIPIDLESVERIEVLEGSGSRILGPNAFSGAINIVTRKPEATNAQLSLIAGQNKYIAPAAALNIGGKLVSTHATISHRQSDGHIENTDFDITNYYLQTFFNTPQVGNLQLQTAFQNRAFGANSFYTPLYPNQFEHLHTLLGSLKWDKQLKKITLEASAHWRRNYDRYELVRGTDKGRNFHRTDVKGLQTRLTLPSILGKTIAGINYRTERIVSTSLGTPLNTPINVGFYNNISPRPQYTLGANRHIIDYYVDHTVFINRFSLSAGALGSWSSEFGNFFYTGGDASYRLNESIKLHAGINQSLRLPNYTELFYKGPGYAADRNLVPEKALTYETGVKYTQNLFSAFTTVFYRQGKNIIDWVKLQEADPWQSKNLTEVNVLGVELSTTYSPKNIWIKRIQASAMWQHLDKASNNYISKYALDNLKYKINAGFDHSLFHPNLLIGWRFTYQDREGTYTNFKTGNEVAYNPFTLVDIRVMYTTPRYNVFVQATNLLNIEYVDIANLQQPGVWVKAGMQITIR